MLKSRHLLLRLGLVPKPVSYDLDKIGSLADQDQDNLVGVVLTEPECLSGLWPGLPGHSLADRPIPAPSYTVPSSHVAGIVDHMVVTQSSDARAFSVHVLILTDFRYIRICTSAGLILLVCVSDPISGRVLCIYRAISRPNRPLRTLHMFFRGQMRAAVGARMPRS